MNAPSVRLPHSYQWWIQGRDSWMTGPPPISIVGWGGGRSSTSPSPACKGDIEYKGPHIQQKGLVIYYYIDYPKKFIQYTRPFSQKLPQTPYTPKYLFSGEKDCLPICNKPTVINTGWWHGRSTLVFLRPTA